MIEGKEVEAASILGESRSVIRDGGLVAGREIGQLSKRKNFGKKRGDI